MSLYTTQSSLHQSSTHLLASHDNGDFQRKLLLELLHGRRQALSLLAALGIVLLLHGLDISINAKIP